MRENSIAEITLRKYESPANLEKRELIKKICLSLGLLQPGDSRDIVVDILQILVESKKSEKKELEVEEIQKRITKNREEHNLEIKGIAESNIRRQLKRLKDIFLVEKTTEGYRINELESLSKLFEEKIEKFYIESIISRIKEYLNELEK
ncbi:hypothetical protein J4465_02545 [Candidatus Pacearchaeota archaeon]|nr:hypothetical protein [Candidatus Pacearchaeota archaeon]